MKADRRCVLLGALAAGVSAAARGQTPPSATGEALPPGLPQPHPRMKIKVAVRLEAGSAEVLTDAWLH